MFNNIRYPLMVESMKCLSNTLTIGPLLGAPLSDCKWSASDTQCLLLYVLSLMADMLPCPRGSGSDLGSAGSISYLIPDGLIREQALTMGVYMGHPD